MGGVKTRANPEDIPPVESKESPALRPRDLTMVDGEGTPVILGFGMRQLLAKSDPSPKARMELNSRSPKAFLALSSIAGQV